MADYDDGKTSTFGRELMQYVASKLPYTGFNTTQLTDTLNPKYKYFEVTGERRAEALSNHSISQNFDYNNQSVASITSDKMYNQIMYANVQKDKLARVKDYRIMSAFSEVSNALDEICDEVINVDSHSGSCLKLEIKNTKLSEVEITNIEKEFDKYVSYFDLNHKGWEYFRQLLIEGEIYWEHIIHQDYKHEGILGVVQIPTELIDPIFSNVQNVLIKGYLLRKPKFDPNNPLKQVGVDYVPLDKNQVTYINSNVWNESKTMRVPFLENCRRAYRQLSMIEDALVIYRLARAPERLVFNVDVGNMPGPKAEAYIRKLVSQYWSSKTFDPSSGGTVQKFNPQSILDNFWFAKRTGSEGTSVTQLAGGCFAMDTKIPLLDGRTLTISEIELELKKEKTIWIYSTNPETGHIVPGLVTWAGVTQKEASVYKLTFNNGKEVICTPDHKFPILGKGFVEAKDLEIGEYMIPFHTKGESNNEYEMVYQNDTKTWEYTHNIVDNFFNNKTNKESTFSEKGLDITNSINLIRVEKLINKIEVGTLTIDNQEKYHNYHTFALDAGIFTKNSNLGQLDDLMYFCKKLYQSLKVPTTRLDPQDAFRDGADMLREELKFAKFIIRLQQTFAGGLKNGFMTHLQLKGMWQDYKLKENFINIEFNVPTNFYELRESQKLELKVSNFSSLAQQESISPTFAQKRYLGWSDIDIKANREFKRKDEAFKWELQQIGQYGPDWKVAMQNANNQMAGAEGGEGGMGGGGLPTGGGGGSALPPPFTGGPASTPEAAPAPETGGVPAPESAPQTAPETPAG